MLGYSASLEGLSRYLGEILALEVRIAEAITDQGTQYTISGIRLDDPELSICEDNLPRPVREFIADQLVLRAA